MISVIVPVYNAEKYLAECIESILNQSVKDIECILVNDGSTDSSSDICRRYAQIDKRVTVVDRENGGVSASRNTGVKIAKGDMIAFVDSDDRLMPGALETLLNIMNESGADIVSGQLDYAKDFTEHTATGKYNVMDGTEARRNMLYQKGYSSSPCGKLYSRNIFDDLAFPEGRRYEDIQFNFEALGKAGKAACCEDVVYFYRANDESFINSFSDSRLDVLTVTREIEEYCERELPEVLRAARDRRLSANFNMAILCHANNRESQSRECWATVKKLRGGSLWNRHVRFKNKAGILLSYMGRKIFMLFA